jgi:predicted phosphodiesterase
VPSSSRFLAFSCTHAPLTDEGAFQWVLSQIHDKKPDVVIHLGDGLEADSASRWPSEAKWTLTEEFEAFNSQLERIREAHRDASGVANLVYIEGNHDANLLAINRIDKKLRDLCDYRSPKNVPELRHWDTTTRYVYDRRVGVYKIGQVSFTHGFEVGNNAGAIQSTQLGDPYGLLVFGHTHRPTPVKRVMLTPQAPLPYWCVNAGTLRDMDSATYMERKRRFMWGQAIVHGEAMITKSPRMSRNWEAETLVYRMFDGEMVN